jgi:signal transduction histidine kinase
MDEKEVQSFLIILSIIAFFLALAIILLFAIFQKRKNKLLREQQETENRFKEEIVESQIEIREDTLRNVSWELHDNIGQLLTLSKIQMQNAKDDPEVIDDAIETISESLRELRKLSRNINPETLSDLTLVEALHLEIERFKRLGYLETSLECSPTFFEIDSKIEIIIFRMLQEFFTNTIKHSKATKLDVSVNYHGDKLTIRAKDNGIGFDVSKINGHKGIGISNIMNRAKLINADVKIISNKGEGSRLSFNYRIN